MHLTPAPGKGRSEGLLTKIVIRLVPKATGGTARSTRGEGTITDRLVSKNSQSHNLPETLHTVDSCERETSIFRAGYVVPTVRYIFSCIVVVKRAKYQ